jgi:hypothetical protein
VKEKTKIARMNKMIRYAFYMLTVSKIHAIFRSKVKIAIRKMRMQWGTFIVIRGFIKALKRNYASECIEMRNQRRIR